MIHPAAKEASQSAEHASNRYTDHGRDDTDLDGDFDGEYGPDENGSSLAIGPQRKVNGLHDLLAECWCRGQTLDFRFQIRKQRKARFVIFQIGAGGQVVINRVRLFKFQLKVVEGDFFKFAQAHLDFIERSLLRLGGRFSEGTVDDCQCVFCVDKSFLRGSFCKESWDVGGADGLIAK